MRYEVRGGYNGERELWGTFASREVAEAYIADMTCNNPALVLEVVDLEPPAVLGAEVPDDSDEVAEAFDLATKEVHPWLNDPTASV